MTAVTIRDRRPTDRVDGGAVPPRPSGVASRVWAGRWRGPAIAAGAAALFAVASGVLTPRGPVSTTEALVAMTAAVVVGVVAGLAVGRRWSALLAVLMFIVVFEVTRMGAVGPTVDGPQLGSLIALLPFVLGRAVHGLLVVLPMLLGGLFGVEMAARLGHPNAPGMRPVGWTTTALLTIVVVVLAGVIARPASTPPILGPDGEEVPGSIAELVTVEIGGHDQVLMIRGRSADLPVLLHLAGGPGGTDIGAMRLDTGLEAHFVVVTWDQRGTGKSYAAFDPADTLTPDQVVADTLEVTEHLRERFGQDRIYLAGQSWGTIPAVLAAQQHPERYHAVVGTGQMVSIRDTDRMFYDDTLAWARDTGDDARATTLEDMGPPPYEDVIADYPIIVAAERDLYPYPEFDGRTEMPATIWVEELSFMDRINAFRGLADTYARLYPQLQTVDLRTDVPVLDVPVHLVMGRHEARGRVEPAREWFDALDAPDKEWTVIEGASHRASFEQPDEYADVLTRILADT